jgi:hypothetical protein
VKADLGLRQPRSFQSRQHLNVPDAARRRLSHEGRTLHENRPGSLVSSDLIFATYQKAGVRAFDIRDRYAPREVGALVPATPKKVNVCTVLPQSEYRNLSFVMPKPIP